MIHDGEWKMEIRKHAENPSEYVEVIPFDFSAAEADRFDTNAGFSTI
jgi:hypothetical protein